jgi:hypothetical protein
MVGHIQISGKKKSAKSAKAAKSERHRATNRAQAAPTNTNIRCISWVRVRVRVRPTPYQCTEVTQDGRFIILGHISLYHSLHGT